MNHEEEAKEHLRQAMCLPFANPRVPNLLAAAQVHATLAVLTQLKQTGT